MIFPNRASAGRQLGEHLKAMGLQNPLLLALPRGGVPVAYEIARLMGMPLEVLIARKVGAPSNPEYGIGAITEDGSSWINPGINAGVNSSISTDTQNTIQAELLEVRRRIQHYRGGRPLPPIEGRTVVLVDDGLATGVTARVACQYLKSKGAKKVILAVPVCSPQTAENLKEEGVVDQLICLQEPEPFYAVGQFYQDFNPVSDEEVIALLSEARNFRGKGSPLSVILQDGRAILTGSLVLPPQAQGLVIFAHGSGSSRLSPRNQRVAEDLAKAGLGTLLFDLLTSEESENRLNVFNIRKLAGRLTLATRWVLNQEFGKFLPLGYFGASTGAAAALWAASELKERISAVVSRGGRPDLATQKLPSVTAPTLLIVGGNDEPVIQMNRDALKYLSQARLEIIPGATHLFEEPGALERVSQEAAQWFHQYLRTPSKQKAA